MNILYQKAKLLGRPFRIYGDDDDGGLGFDLTNTTGVSNPGGDVDYIGGGGDDGSNPGGDVDYIGGGGDDGSNLGGDVDYIGGGGDDGSAPIVSQEEIDAIKAMLKPAGSTDSLDSYYGGATKAEQDAINAAIKATGLKVNEIPKGMWDTLKNAFKNADGSYDFAKLGFAGGALLSMTGLGKAKPGGYQGTVPKLTATREQIKYDDPNRRPGAGGRDYFTDTIYSPEKDTAAIDTAKAAAKTQGEGILAGYKKADVAAPATTKFKLPYEKTAATTGTTAGAATTGIAAALPAVPNAIEIANQTSSEAAQQPTTLAAGGPAMKQPRYLRGITDGMEDKINTSIDDKQPAKLSHGEFVVPADVVSHLGNGNSDAGAKKLYQMMDRIRHARTGTKQQGKQINPDKFMPGGKVGYQSGGIASFVTGGAVDTTTSSGLAPYVGDFVTQTLGEAQAAAAQPYQTYTGPLTAGESDLQKSAFAGVKDLASTGYTPATFTSGTFDTAAANKYMNPFLEASLNPQMKELRRQAQISNMGSMAKAGRAGIMSGDSRNLMESENMRNLLSKQSDVLGTGYATAYDKAMNQFNTEQGRDMDAQKASEASRVYSADYSRNILGDMANLGKTQRDIEAEGIAADKTEFEKQRDYDKEMAQYKIGLLQKLPVDASTTEANTNPITDYIKNSGTIIAMFKQMGLIK